MNQPPTLPLDAINSLWSIAWPLVAKYGAGAMVVFIVVAWLKQWLPLHGTMKKVIIPILSVVVGIAARCATVAGEVSTGSPSPTGLLWILEVVRGIGIGITASFFQKIIGWRVEQWFKAKLGKG